MMNAPAPEYSPIAKILHWWVAGMIVLQFVLAKLAERAADASLELNQLALLANHKSVGITVFLLAVIRLVWRRHETPPAPLPMPSWQEKASRLSHWSLYAFLFLMPISGWLMSSASAYSVSWFNILQLPDLVGPSESLKETFESIHKTLAKLLLLVAAIHVTAGLKHAFIDKNGALARISSQMSLAIFAVVVFGGYMSLSDVGEKIAGPNTPAEIAAPTSSALESIPRTDLPLWQINYDASYIRFSGEQAGASFAGEWREWSAELRFSSTAPDAGFFDVTIDTTSVNTENQERDETIIAAEWFDVVDFPQVFFRADRFAVDENGEFTALGEMLVKNLRSPVALKFTLSERPGYVILDGIVTLDRITLQLGTGEWADTEVIGQFVDVTVHVEADVAE